MLGKDSEKCFSESFPNNINYILKKDLPYFNIKEKNIKKRTISANELGPIKPEDLLIKDENIKPFIPYEKKIVEKEDSNKIIRN